MATLHMNKASICTIAILILCIFTTHTLQESECECKCCYRTTCIVNSTTVSSCQQCTKQNCEQHFYECSDLPERSAQCFEGDTVLNNIFVFTILSVLGILIILASLIEWFPHKFPQIDTFFKQT